MVPAAVASYCMPFFHKALQYFLRNRVVVQVPTQAIANFYGIRAGCHVDGKRPLVENAQFFQPECGNLCRHRVQMPIQRQPCNSVGHRRQLCHLQQVMGKVPQKAVHRQTIGARHLQISQRQIDK